MDLPQYSTEALFEALANAVAHRDYSIRGSRIRLSMFADRVENPVSRRTGPTVSPLKSWNIARQPVTRSSPRSSAGCQPVESRGRAGDSSSWSGVVTASPSFAEKPGNSPGACHGSTWSGARNFAFTLPAASTEPNPVRVLISVRADDLGLANTELLVLFPNKTWKQATTDALGEASIGLHKDDLPMTVFAAAHGFCRALRTRLDPLGGCAHHRA